MATAITKKGAAFTSQTGSAHVSFVIAGRQLVQRCDTGDADAQFNVDDLDALYTATVRSRPFYLSGLLNKSGVMAGTLLAKAIAAGAVFVRLVRDYGDETFAREVDLTPEDSETAVMTLIDDLSLSEMTAAALEFSDSTTAPNTEWQLHQFGLKPRSEQTP
jgi:hypothetical protein